jgi:hypothetical protein
MPSRLAGDRNFEIMREVDASLRKIGEATYKIADQNDHGLSYSRSVPDEPVTAGLQRRFTGSGPTFTLVGHLQLIDLG